ncbi:MAG TPA: YciI family protein [Gaiellaceae bacterium]|nr:YciI family protein [Gaiellaceae bacterium]
MRYLLLIHGDREAEAALSPDERRTIVGEHIAYASMLRERGAHVLGEALDDPSTAAVVRPGEKPFVTDGPFAETKEGLGGFYVVEVASRDEALELAGRIPQSPGVAVEVLPIIDV